MEYVAGVGRYIIAYRETKHDCSQRRRFGRLRVQVGDKPMRRLCQSDWGGKTSSESRTREIRSFSPRMHESRVVEVRNARGLESEKGWNGPVLSFERPLDYQDLGPRYRGLNR